MKKIMYEINLGWAGVGEEDEMEVDDNATDSDIDAMVHEMALECASSWEGDQRLMSEEEWEDEDNVQHFYDNASGSWRWVDEPED